MAYLEAPQRGAQELHQSPLDLVYAQGRVVPPMDSSQPSETHCNN